MLGRETRGKEKDGGRTEDGEGVNGALLHLTTLHRDSVNSIELFDRDRVSKKITLNADRAKQSQLTSASIP